MPKHLAKTWLKGMKSAAYAMSDGEERTMGQWIQCGHIYSHLNELANATAELSEEQLRVLDRIIMSLAAKHDDWSHELLVALVPLATYINTRKQENARSMLRAFPISRRIEAASS